MSSKPVPKLRDPFNNAMRLLVNAWRGEAVEGFGFQKSCINCMSFRERDEMCVPANARPPARIIAFGCESHRDNDDIPF